MELGPIQNPYNKIYPKKEINFEQTNNIIYIYERTIKNTIK